MKQIAHTPHRQQGIALLIAMIMLVLMTLLVVTSLNLGKSSLQTVGNMQQRNQTVAAAQEVVEEVISSKKFIDSPNAVFATPCNGVANTKCVDLNGDGIADVTVTLTPSPTCVQATTIKLSELDFNNADDRDCSVGPTGPSGIAGNETGSSFCANSTWEVTAQATDAVTQATAVVVQGTSQRIKTTSVTTSCP